MKTLQIILGNQLFDYKYYQKKSDIIFMAEDFGLCRHFKYHKHKIIHFLASMREFRDYLMGKGKTVYYFELKEKSTYLGHLKQVINEQKIEKVTLYEVEDHFFEQELVEFFEKEKLDYEFLRSPMFFCSREEFKEYLESCNKPLLNNFYKKMRLKNNILLDQEDKPLGGKWNYDSENRKKIAKKFEVDQFHPPALSSKHIDDIKEVVSMHFNDHPGDNENYWIPTNRAQAIEWFKTYLNERFIHFGRYQDAIDDRAPFLYHSVISPFVNIGFLTPMEVVREVEKRLNDDNLNDVEGFIRQVMGWREFLRGIYQNFGKEQEESNFFNHKKKLTDHWYKGTTGVKPLDDCIKKADEWGYCHHIERLMIISNIMLLLEIHPKEVYAWFMEMFADSSDWVMGPNIFGMGQFSDGGIFATKPYFSGSNYILKMSNYPKDDWCDAIDGLYWRFIDKNREFMKKNHRLSMMVSMFDKMDDDKKKRIMLAASELQQKITL